MNKKVLIIPSWYPSTDNSIVGSFFKEQAALMDKNYYDIKILFAREHRLKTSEYLKYAFMRLLGKKSTSLDSVYLLQNPEAYAFDVYYYKKWSRKRILKTIAKQYHKMVSQIIEDSWKPDLIHAQCTVNAGIYANFLRQNLNIPYVIIEHQVFLLHHYDRTHRKAMISALENASKVGAVSNHQKRCILMNSIQCDPNIIWNLVDEDRFKLSESKKKQKFTITTITYPAFIKDTSTFFRSIQEFTKLNPDDFEVIVIGNDAFDDINNANTNIFEKLAKQYNIQSKCTFIPFLDRDAIAKQLQTSDVFVSTSIAETYGVAVREAMLCGVPVIVTKSGGVEDSINDKTGITVNIGDDKAIAAALLKLKNKEIAFDPAYIRNFIISQCGKTAFIKMMNDFYN